MSFSTEQIVFQDQGSSFDGKDRIVAWIDLKKIQHGYGIENSSYVKIGFTGVDDDTIIICFYKEKVDGALELKKSKKSNSIDVSSRAMTWKE